MKYVEYIYIYIQTESIRLEFDFMEYTFYITSSRFIPMEAEESY